MMPPDHRRRSPHEAGFEAAGRPNALGIQNNNTAKTSSRPDGQAAFDDAIIKAIAAINDAAKGLSRDQQIAFFAEFGFTFSAARGGA